MSEQELIDRGIVLTHEKTPSGKDITYIETVEQHRRNARRAAGEVVETKQHRGGATTTKVVTENGTAIVYVSRTPKVGP